MIGWLVKKIFDRTVKSAEYFMRNDPRVKTAVLDAAKAMKKVEDDLHHSLEEKYGDTPEKIADRAKGVGMSVEKYMFFVLLKYPDGSRRRTSGNFSEWILDRANKVKVLEPGQNPGEFKFIKRLTIWSVPYKSYSPPVTRENTLDRAKQHCAYRGGDTLMNLTFDERTDTQGEKIISLSADVISVCG